MSQNIVKRDKQEINAPFHIKSAGVSLVVILAIGSYFIANLLTLLPSEQAVPDGAISLTIITIVLIVIVQSVLQIVLFIGAGKIEEEGEQDKVVSAKAAHNGYLVMAIGVFATFASMFADFTPFEMGSLLMGAFFLAEITRFASQIMYYRRSA